MWYSWITMRCGFSLFLFSILFSSLVYFCISFMFVPLPPPPAHLLSPLLYFQTFYQHFIHPQSPSHNTCPAPHPECRLWAWDMAKSNLCPLWYDNSVPHSSEINSPWEKSLGSWVRRCPFLSHPSEHHSHVCPSSILSLHLSPPEVWSRFSLRHGGVSWLKSLCNFTGLFSQGKGGCGDNQALETN